VKQFLRFKIYTPVAMTNFSTYISLKEKQPQVSSELGKSKPCDHESSALPFTNLRAFYVVIIQMQQSQTLIIEEKIDKEDYDWKSYCKKCENFFRQKRRDGFDTG